ncbi:MAG: hypothetical protein QOJ04_1415 [Caballeronia sp.]|jgi:hypothetical protein|nr:hypothetical protein [Caballeronia sp.]MEA3111228.1 hypothetical protein [Caballeronia sp.]
MHDPERQFFAISAGFVPGVAAIKPSLEPPAAIGADATFEGDPSAICMKQHARWKPVRRTGHLRNHVYS